MGMGTSSMALATSIKLSVPREADANEGIEEPISPPKLALAAIMPNRLPALC